MYAWVNNEDRWTPYHVQGLDFEYAFATRVEAERFAAIMRLPINWI